MHHTLCKYLASADYTSKSVDLIFGPSNKKQCVLIQVTNDTVPEVPEHFSVVLSMTTPLAGVVLTPDNATVVINDDDGEYMLIENKNIESMYFSPQWLWDLNMSHTASVKGMVQSRCVSK